MSILALLRKKYSVAVATAIPAIPATHGPELAGTVARIATVAVANLTKAEITSPVGHDDVDVTDDRRFCTQCGNLRGDVCSIAFPGGPVSAIVGYRPVLDILHRCKAFLPEMQPQPPKLPAAWADPDLAKQVAHVRLCPATKGNSE